MSYIAVRQLMLSVLELAMEMAVDYANAYEDMRQQYARAPCVRFRSCSSCGGCLGIRLMCAGMLRAFGGDTWTTR